MVTLSISMPFNPAFASPKINAPVNIKARFVIEKPESTSIIYVNEFSRYVKLLFNRHQDDFLIPAGVF
jgi:hypothetical protein